VHGNTIGTHLLYIDGYLQHIRIVATPRIAQRGEFVDVYRELGHRKIKSA
jgi:hypothetical protein